jgi:hypothetical protein
MIGVMMDGFVQKDLNSVGPLDAGRREWVPPLPHEAVRMALASVRSGAPAPAAAGSPRAGRRARRPAPEVVDAPGVSREGVVRAVERSGADLGRAAVAAVRAAAGMAMSAGASRGGASGWDAAAAWAARLVERAVRDGLRDALGEPGPWPASCGGSELAYALARAWVASACAGRREGDARAEAGRARSRLLDAVLDAADLSPRPAAS